MIFLIILCGGMIGWGIALLLSPLLPRQVQLSDALENLQVHKPSLQQVQGEEVTARTPTRQERVGSWVIAHLPEGQRLQKFVGVNPADLEILGLSKTEFYYQRALWGLIGGIAPLALSMTMSLLNIPLIIPILLVLPCAGLGWYLRGLQLKERAEQARHDFTRSVAVFLELVAMERRRGAAPSVALENAASIGDSWVFTRLKQQIAYAKYTYQQPWEALVTLGENIQVPSLIEAAKIVQLAGESGAAVYTSLKSAGTSLRVKMLNETHEKANRDSESLSVFIPLLSIVFIGIMLFPLMLNLFNA